MQNKHLPDTQNTTDIRNIVINEVGIKDILHPINFIIAIKSHFRLWLILQ